MNDDLYFIPMIDRALSQPDAVAALRETFTEITHMGNQARYRRGFEQFQRFIAEVLSHMDATGDESQATALQRILTEAAPTESDSGSGSEAITGQHLVNIAEIQKLLRGLRDLSVSVSEPPAEFGMSLLREGQVISHIATTQSPTAETASGLEPGHYELVLDTGRVIWEGELTGTDLLWSAAFPGRPITLAADTGQADESASRVISLLDGEVVVRVFPGIESGRLRIEVATTGRG